MIIGATGGLGKALATLYAPNCKKLILVGRSKEKLIKLQKELEDIQKNIEIIELDLRENSQIETIFSSIKADLILNIAGMGGIEESIQSIPMQEEVLQVNFIAPVYITKILAEKYANQSMVLVHIGSFAALYPHPFMAYYGATKSALTNYVLAVNEELKLTRKKFRIYIYLPGAINTDFFSQDTKRKMGGLFLLPKADKIAKNIVRYILKEKEYAVIGKRYQVLHLLLLFLPRRLYLHWIGRILQRGL